MSDYGVQWCQNTELVFYIKVLVNKLDWIREDSGLCKCQIREMPTNRIHVDKKAWLQTVTHYLDKGVAQG